MHEVQPGRDELLPERLVGNDGDGAPEAGQVKGLARRHEGDGPRLDVRVKRRDGHVLVPRIDQIAVDLVGTDHESAPETDLGHATELFTRVHPSHGVVGVAEHEHARAGGDGPLERVPVHRVATIASSGEIHGVAGQPHIVGQAQDGRVHGQLLEQPVARRGEGATGDVEAGDHTRQEHEGLRLDPPALALEEPLAHDLVEFGLLDAVAEDAVLHTLAEGPGHRLRGGEVHVGDPERQDIGRELVPLRALGGSAVDLTVEVVRHGSEE